MKIELQLNCTGGWVDYTKWVNITKLTRELSLDENDDPQKEQTGTIELFGDAYTFVANNLISGPNMYSNSMCIRITDDACTGYQYFFKIDNKNLKWCDDNGCSMEFEMQGYEPELDCVRNTAISDNTNGVFDEYGAYTHPRFRYCDVTKPTLFFAWIMYFANIFDLLVNFVNTVIYILQVVFPSLQPFNNPSNLLGGCNRAWPSPYLRTYIDNVCTICGLTANATTAPPLYSLTNPFTPAEGNQYYYATLLTAYTKKGVSVNGNKLYIWNNRPSWTLDAFLGHLKGLWNARWFVNNGKVYFHRKDKIGELIWGNTPVLDFTTDDAKKLLQGVCYMWNGQGKVKRLYMKYGNDSSDAIGNELLNRFNGEFLDTSGNPNYTEKIERENGQFGAQSYVRDLNDSLYDWILINAVSDANTGIVGPLKTTTDTCNLAKVIIHNSATPLLDARALATPYAPYQTLPEFQDDDNFVNSLTPLTGYVYNYPMSFSPQQAGINNNLWQYHYIDAPSPNKKTNIAFEFTLQYCCEFGNLNIYQKVKMKNGDIGEISSVTYDHFNRTINVKGNLI